jgi:hypothetical protein
MEFRIRLIVTPSAILTDGLLTRSRGRTVNQDQIICNKL